MQRSRIPGFTLLLAIAGCSGSSAPPPPPVHDMVPISILTQPASQRIPLGRPAIFSVTTTGSTPQSYQWTENGSVIPGATNPTYTTPNVTDSDNNATFQVTVSNAAGSVTSAVATLTIGPRAPAMGDLRYLQWEQAPYPGGLGIQTNGVGHLGVTTAAYTNAVGVPLSLGTSWVATQNNNNCDWYADASSVPPPAIGLSVYYDENFTNYTPAVSYLQSILAPNAVIFSMDLEPACQDIGVAWIQTSQTGGFDGRVETVPYGSNMTTSIQNQVAADGAQGRIVTAVTLDDQNQQAILISYGWQEDTTNTYETTFSVVQTNQIQATGATMANAGYFISAFGGNDTDGYVLIGTRVLGDAMPRPFIQNGTPVGYNSPISPSNANFTPVLWIFYPNGGGTFWEQ
jgi:hypothetical protein